MTNRHETLKCDRIGGIDVLRAFALFGILLVHTVESFGFFYDDTWGSEVDSVFFSLTANVFGNKSNAIFSLLFGCSFWFLLRNSNYRSLKFVWRCVLLMAVGVVAKIFYTFDILMWYGLNGAILVLFRHSGRRVLLAVATLLILFTPLVNSLDIGWALIGPELPVRYVDGYSLVQVMKYPLIDSIATGMGACMSTLSLRTLGLMMLGYWLGREGYITRWRELGTWRMTAAWFMAVMVMYAVVFLLRSHYQSSIVLQELLNMQFVVQAIFMSVLVLTLCRDGGRWMEPLACYGRLGLTNYFFQGVVGVALFSEWFIPHRFGFMPVLGIMIGFYVMQVIFSVIWCRTHRYGPLEYLWRKATSIIPDRR